MPTSKTCKISVRKFSRKNPLSARTGAQGVNQADVKQRMQNLFSLNSAIDERQRNIDNIQKDITGLDGDIDILQRANLTTLSKAN